MDVLQLDNATVRKYIPIAGTMAEGYFTRFAPDALRRPLGDVLDVAAVARHYGTLQAMLQDTGLEPLPGLGEEASVCFAFLSGLASLDVNVAQSGLTVTDGQRDAVHGHLAMGMCRQGDVGQRPGQQRVFELPTAMQGITAHGAAEAAHVIHQSEAQRLHPRVGRDGIEPGQRRR